MHRRLPLLLALATIASTGACRRAPEAPTPAPPGLHSDHGDPLPYAGVWIGPELVLSFAGPWVLIEPRNPGPDDAPIELRVTIERRVNETFALATSVAGVAPGTFLRPSDWTMMVEPNSLALAMGDEPLHTYLPAPERPPPLLGPERLGEAELPPADELTTAETLACLEFASRICTELEGEGPRLAGCREAEWSVCAEHLGPPAADPTIRAAEADDLALRSHAIALRYLAGVEPGEGPSGEAELRAARGRGLEASLELLAEILERGPLPAADPNLLTIAAYLRHARDRGLLDDEALDWSALP